MKWKFDRQSQFSQNGDFVHFVHDFLVNIGFNKIWTGSIINLIHKQNDLQLCSKIFLNNNNFYLNKISKF